MNTKIIKLDINKRLYEKITAKQGDTKSRFLLFHLLDEGVPFSLTDRTVRVYGLKPDNKEIFNDLQIVDVKKGYCKLELTSQALAVPGDLDLELVIMEGESKLSSIPFVVEVLKSLNSKSAIESSNEYKALDRSLTKVEEWNNEFADKSGKLEQLYTERLNGIDSHLAETAKVINVGTHPLFDANDISIAFNNIMSECKENDIIVLDSGVYKTKSILIVNKNVTVNLNGVLTFDGSDETCIRISSICRCNVYKIATSLKGKIGIEITECYHGILNIGTVMNFKIPLLLCPNKYRTGHNEGIQYMKINFDTLQADKLDNSDGCITFKPGNTDMPWINENTFTGGRLIGIKGIKTFKGDSQIDAFNNNKFYNIGCEDIEQEGIDLTYCHSNSFNNFRFENVKGIYIKEDNQCRYNRYDLSYPIAISKLSIQGRGSFLNAYVVDGGGRVVGTRRFFNNFGTDETITEKIFSNSEVGFAYCEENKPLYDRFAFVLKATNGDIINIPCREGSTHFVNNTNFTMKYLYKDLRVLSNNNAVTITIPNKFKYDGAEFNISSNFNTNDITIVDESGVEQFKITNSEGVGTWNVLFVGQLGKFSKIKISDKARSF